MTSFAAARSFAAAAVLLGAALPALADDGARSPFSGLNGTWSGDGTITLADGSSEKIRCRASYAVEGLGMALTQALRCASASYQFDVQSNVRSDAAGALAGTWSEATRQVSGDISGHAAPGRIETAVATLGFSAQLSVATRGTRQTVSIVPQGTDIRVVRIDMRRI